MSMNNLTIDGEFRYVVQWFNEWSELQRDDFIPILVEYLATKATNATFEISPTASAKRDTIDTNSHTNTNGIAEDIKNILIINEKPLSLFQCRIKLFRQWHPKWPLEFKGKLQQKIIEIDEKVGARIASELKRLQSTTAAASACTTNVNVNGKSITVTNEPSSDEKNSFSDSILEVLREGKETSVDDIENVMYNANKPNDDDAIYNNDNNNNTQQRQKQQKINDVDLSTSHVVTEKPVEQVKMHKQLFNKETASTTVTDQQQQEELQQQTMSVAVTVNSVNSIVTQAITTTTTTNAEVPLVA
ncbi:uncharacterized protein LOC119634742 [Glossina fuscipes]|uniref:Uncharacterized protein LOC119634742 n=1 Tax=Glossina fuscipes TaxID=7396 RepID=A0A8U0WJB4_9MUSC|nr:uncharacterized protein LOC119634742 [Glossina fuscipes]XP_037885010.1 uncharacterized protein LOC119634742 [Glossina fuscipes]XP_037885012.1 uncharacterized protein LOC119634742 [Glossina fuscipes]XP_037885013.1 uncharacterized protein LOC119634742 [Glossina fuscipes]KAI9584912.1 hypothetical protein GQX74_006807 [Glossina fuscipes]